MSLDCPGQESRCTTYRYRRNPKKDYRQGLSIIRGDIQDAVGSLQLCAGQFSGIEAAVHAVREGFQQEDTEAVLLVDATNAFNSLNRQVALRNIRRICSTILINTYRPVRRWRCVAL